MTASSSCTMPTTKPRARFDTVGHGDRSCRDGRSPVAVHVQAKAGRAAVLQIQEPGLEATGGDRARVAQRDARLRPGGARWARRAFVHVFFHAARAPRRAGSGIDLARRRRRALQGTLATGAPGRGRHPTTGRVLLPVFRLAGPWGAVLGSGIAVGGPVAAGPDKAGDLTEAWPALAVELWMPGLSRWRAAEGRRRRRGLGMSQSVWTPRPGVFPSDPSVLRFACSLSIQISCCMSPAQR